MQLSLHKPEQTEQCTMIETVDAVSKMRFLMTSKAETGLFQELNGDARVSNENARLHGLYRIFV